MVRFSSTITEREHLFLESKSSTADPWVGTIKIEPRDHPIYNLSTPSTFDGGRARDRLLTRITRAILKTLVLMELNIMEPYGKPYGTVEAIYPSG